MESCNRSNKRCRDEPDESPAKRHHADLFFDILDDDDAVYCDAADGDISTVIHSLEKEIGLPAAKPAADLESGSGQQGLDYLLAASDDELGLPPAEESASSSVEEIDCLTHADASPSSSCNRDDGVGELESAGFGQIWGLDDDIWGFCGGDMGFGMSPEDGVGDGYYTEELFVQPDFSDLL